jgi:outer membrane protein assembly factor BamB
MRIYACFFLLCSFLLLLPITLSKGDHKIDTSNSNWTRFRGPNGTGIAFANSLPVSWTEKDYNWKIKLPGKGHSSPVVWKSSIFVTSADESLNRGYILAFNVQDGAMIWQKDFNIKSYDINEDNSLATSTPTVDADRIYTIWYSQQKTFLMASDHQGKEIWRANFDGTYSRHGAASSPVVYGDLVVISREQEGESPFASSWVAVDRNSGKVIWELEREKTYRFSVSTPCLFNSDDQTPQLLFASRAHGFTIVDMISGKILWESGPVFNHRVVASPIVSQGMLIGTCKKKLVAFNLDHHDNIFTGKLSYELPARMTSYVPTPIVNEGLLFVCIDNGNVACINLLSGEVLWREKPAGAFYSSPVMVNGILYCITKKGEVVVLKATEKYELLAINQLGEESYATPAVAGGRMYLRTFSHLISIGTN